MSYQAYANEASAAAAQARGDSQPTTTGHAPAPASSVNAGIHELQQGDAAEARDQAKSGIALGHVLDGTDPAVAARRQQLAGGEAATAARGIQEPSVTGHVPDPASSQAAGYAAEAEAEANRLAGERAAGIKLGHVVPNPPHDGHPGSGDARGFGGSPGFAGNAQPTTDDFEAVSNSAAAAARGHNVPTATGHRAPAPASSEDAARRAAKLGDGVEEREAEEAGIKVGRVLP